MPTDDAIDLQCAEYGPTSGPAVVLLHGFPLNRSMWDDQIDALASRFRVLIPDLRGHGASDAPPGPYTMRQHVRDVVRLLDRSGIERAALVGLSMGGYVAMNLMATHADRIWALALLDTRAEGDTEPSRAMRARQATEIKAEGLEPFIQTAIGRMFARDSIEREPELVARYRRMVEPARPASVIAALQGLALRSDVSSVLRGVRCPTLVIVGAEDSVTPPDDARRIAELVPGARLEVIPDVAHLSNMEAPARVNELLVGLLTDATP